MEVSGWNCEGWGTKLLDLVFLGGMECRVPFPPPSSELSAGSALYRLADCVLWTVSTYLYALAKVWQLWRKFGRWGTDPV